MNTNKIQYGWFLKRLLVGLSRYGLTGMIFICDLILYTERKKYLYNLCVNSD